jgi:hypothetical protein
MGWYELDSSGLGHELMAGCCEHGNELEIKEYTVAHNTVCTVM